MTDPIEPTEAERKRELLKKNMGKEKRLRASAMPISKAILNGLLNKLDAELSSGGGHDLTHTTAFLKSRNVDLEPALEWLREQGGDSDREILENVEAL